MPAPLNTRRVVTKYFVGWLCFMVGWFVFLYRAPSTGGLLIHGTCRPR